MKILATHDISPPQASINGFESKLLVLAVDICCNSWAFVVIIAVEARDDQIDKKSGFLKALQGLANWLQITKAVNSPYGLPVERTPAGNPTMVVIHMAGMTQVVIRSTVDNYFDVCARLQELKTLQVASQSIHVLIVSCGLFVGLGSTVAVLRDIAIMSM